MSLFFSLQELETGLVETAKSFVSYDDWTKNFVKIFSDFGYYLVRNNSVNTV